MNSLKKIPLATIFAASVALGSMIKVMPVTALTTILINEEFNDISAWKDLSTAVTWDNHPAGTSAFQIFDIDNENKAVGLANGSIQDSAGNLISGLASSYYNANGLKGFSSLDWQFNQLIDHATSTVTIEFRVKWSALNNSSSGEAGRFIVSLNHDYPVDGLDITPNAKYNDFSAGNTWAKPAYHVRIRAGNDSSSFAMLQYGGGSSADGEYERYDADQNGIPDWWLPGFIQNAGGGSPGTGEAFPSSSWSRSDIGLASTSWQTFRYIITPTSQELWHDPTGSGDFTRQISMPLPSESTAPFYQYFPQFTGVRLYWRAGGPKGQVLVDSLSVKVDTADPEKLENNLNP